MLNDAYDCPIGKGIFYIGAQSQTGRPTVYYTEGITAGKHNGEFMVQESNGVVHRLDPAEARRLYPLSHAALTTVIEQGMVPVEWVKARLPKTNETQHTLRRAEARNRRRKELDQLAAA